MEAVAAEDLIASANTYRWMKNPPKVGELRVRSWRYLIPPASSDDPMWLDRCKQYWLLQQETYGIAVSDHAMMIDFDEQIVTTAAVIMRVLPGRRVRDYTAPRARAN